MQRTISMAGAAAVFSILALARFAAADVAATTPAAGDTGVASSPAGTGSAASSETGSIDLHSVPDIPALTALNATGNPVDRPASASGLGTSLANVIDASGAVKSGIGIEVSPHAFGIDRRWSFQQYKEDWWRRTLTQSALSIGTVRTSATSTASSDTRAAIGLRLVLWDAADPLLDLSYLDVARAARKACAQQATPSDQANCEGRVFDQSKDWKPIRWNAGGLFVAAAQTWDFADGNLRSHKAERLSSWLAGSLGISDWGQVALGGVWDHGWHATSDKLSAALRLRVGGTRYRFMADGTWFAVRDMNTASGRWAAGAELQVNSGVWLTASVGADIGGMSSQAASLLSSVKWGYSQQGPQPGAM